MSHLRVITIHLSVFIGLARTGDQFWLSLTQNETLSIVSITIKRKKNSKKWKCWNLRVQ